MKKEWLYTLFLLTIPTVVVTVVVLVLMHWHIPTHVRVNLTVNRAVFTVGSDWALIINPARFQSITIQGFDRIELNPEKLEVADPVQYEIIEDSYPESAWKSIVVTSPVSIIGENQTLQPAVTLESGKPAQIIAGTLDGIYANRGSVVTMEARKIQAMMLTIRVEDHEFPTILSVHEPFQLITEHVQFSGIEGLPYQSDSLTFRAQLPDHGRSIKITTAKEGSLLLILTILSEESTGLFSTGGIPVTSLDFSRLDKIGNRVTALVKAGEITYPDYQDYSGVEKVSLEDSDFIGLDQLEKFSIKKISLDPEHKGIGFVLEGMAGHLRTGSQEFPTDHRLTLFNALWKNPKLAALFTIIIWVFPITVGAYRLYRALKRG